MAPYLIFMRVSKPTQFIGQSLHIPSVLVLSLQNVQCFYISAPLSKLRPDSKISLNSPVAIAGSICGSSFKLTTVFRKKRHHKQQNIVWQYFCHQKSARKILKSTNLLKLMKLQFESSGATCSEQLTYEHCNIDGNVAILRGGGAEHLI